ncbi:hypothetical protein HYU96_00330, partial [Candidatus Daviesbacteria bacterium]|nr:hypothetical protein [Candidatus Daviesbacteria bacterium]
MNIRKKILGGIPGLYDEFDEADFEKETSGNGIFEAIVSLGQDIAGMEKFPSTGTIEFNKKAQEETEQKEIAAAKKAFFQALKEDQQRAKDAKERLLFEEEMDGIITNLPTDQKNRLLHYQASYRDRSIYQRAELRKKIIEEQKKADQQQKEAAIPSPAKQPTAMQGAFEGRSGTQG